MTGKPLNVVVVEDRPDDAALLVRELRRVGYDLVLEIVDNATDLRDVLERGPWDLVLSDYALPGFTGFEALRIVKAADPGVPFILVSGTIGEDVAVEAMRGGADDFLMKQRLARLGPAVDRALEEAGERRARRRAEAAVLRRDAILRGVVSAGERLLREPDWRAGIQQVLAELGAAIEVSRIYVFENHTGEQGERLASQRHEWTADGVPAYLQDPALQDLSWRAGGFARWEAILSRGESLHARVLALHPTERQALSKSDVVSVGAVPIFVGERWWGFLGFDDCRAERDWSAAELDALKAAAGTIGAAIQRRQAEEGLERQLRRLAGLRAINVATTASLDLAMALDVVLDQVVGQLGVDAASVLLLRPREAVLEFAAGRGFTRPAIRHARMRLGEGYAGRAAAERAPIALADLRAAPGFARAEPLISEGFVAYRAIPLLVKGQVRGVLELFHRAAFEPGAEWLEFANTLAGQAAVAIDNALLFDDLQRSNLELTLAYDTTLEGWSKALDLRDKETEGHTRRVTELTVRLARALGIREPELVHVRRGALLHDIGKMGIPDRILLKPGPLTPEEWAVMRLHPIYAYELLAPIPFLRPALDIPYCHHEKWDGSGYPRGLRGEVIPLSARAFAVVDVWDALRSDRPYRAAWPEGRVRAHVAAAAGVHFDPRVVEVFLGTVLDGTEPAPAAAERRQTA